jgi:hypothetical protein
MPIFEDEIFNDDEELGGVKKTKVIKKSTQITDMQSVRVLVRLTWYTYFHWASSVNNDVANALRRRGFIVTSVSSSQLGGSQSSTYSFNILLKVYPQYSLNDVRLNAFNALSEVAAPNSISFTSVNLF